MARSTLTKRQAPPRPTADKGEPARLDLGTVVAPKGTLVKGTTVGGDKVVGTLVSVDCKNGEPYTAAIYTTGNYRSTRHVYVDTVLEVLNDAPRA